MNFNDEIYEVYSKEIVSENFLFVVENILVQLLTKVVWEMLNVFIMIFLPWLLFNA